jgi:diguanylate cyclase (GGDEF)-like protein/PAS domain S-box-containing protein
MPDLGDRITREITIRYVAVLAMLALVALVSFAALTRVIHDTQGGAERIGLAGRQRMLVERVAFAANRLALSDAADLTAKNQRLKDALDLLERNHIAFAEGAIPLPSEVRDVFRADPWNLDRIMRDFIARGRRIEAKAGAMGQADADLAELSQATSGALMDALDEVVARLQKSSEDLQRLLMVLQGISLALALGIIALAALGVFRPLVQRLKTDMEDRERTAKELKESEERLWRILEESPIGVSVSRRSDGVVVFANGRFTDILGMPKSEFIGSSARDHYVDDTQRKMVLQALRTRGRIDSAEVEFRRRTGEAFWSLLTIHSTNFHGENVNLAWIYDITERKSAEQQILLAAKVLETVNEGVVITNAANEIIFVNPAFTMITEYSRDEILGRNPKVLHSGRHDGDFYSTMWSQLKAKGRWSGEVWNRRKSGEFYAEWLSISVIRDAAGGVLNHVAVFTDITHRKEDEERVWRQANYDALTGLPNRSLFMDRLAQTARQARREGKGFGLLFLDLDGFKAVNDTLGHAAGDVLLQQTATRLVVCMRGSDTLARLAGDEFVAILPGNCSREDLAVVANKILVELARPYRLDEGVAEVRGSIGIAIFPEDAEDSGSLLRAADKAMYAVKKSGKNNFVFAGDVAVTPES